MKYPNLTSATIIKDSITSRGHRMTTVKMVFPRYILAELNTHRVFGRNSASSRAIPFRKMVRSAIDNPYVPMAFQKDHVGMQGTEYLDPNKTVTFPIFLDILKNTFKLSDDDIEEATRSGKDADLAGYIWEMMGDVESVEFNLIQWWLYCRDQAIKCAILMSSLGVTKQLCNRILEPFIYHTALVTSTEWDNFFELRSPKYIIKGSENLESIPYKSKKVILNTYPDLSDTGIYAKELSTENWLTINKGQGEIHIMDLAEKTWDAMNESTPDILKDGEWHIPFGDNILISGTEGLEANTKKAIKIATARAARISYESLGDNPKIDYEADIKLHDNLLKSGHFSPFEHISQVPNDTEYDEALRGKEKGWFANFRGFKSYRFSLGY